MARRNVPDNQVDISRKNLSAEEKAFREYASKGFGNIFYNSPIAMAVTSFDGLWCIEVNNAFLELFEYRRKDVIRNSFVNLDLYPDPNHHTQLLQLLKDKGAFKNYEIAMRTKTGKPLVLLLSLFRTTIGDIEYLIGSSVDITERKRAEKALRESMKVSTAILNASWDSITLIDTSGLVLTANAASAGRFGITPSEMTGRCVYDFLPPDLAATRKAFAEQVIQTGKPVVWEDEREGRSYEIIEYPVHDETGQVARIVIYANDITERKVTEEALRESQELFHTVLNSIDAAVYVADMDSYEILFANEFMKQIFGDITGQVCWKAIQKDQAGPCPFCTNSRLLTTPQGEPAGPITWEFNNALTGDWVECHDRAIRWLDGRIVRIEVATGINTRKRAEKALQKAHDELEFRVQERTAELRSRTEQLNEYNMALKVLLDQRDKDRQDMEERFLLNVKQLVLPYLENLSGMSLGPRQKTLVSIARANLDQIVSPFLQNMHCQFSGFTPAELRVAGFIKDGRTVKEIANILGLSESGVNSHRQNIRKKLGLTDRKVNLRTRLQSLGDMPQLQRASLPACLSGY
ncbi:MAG: multi-sensor signal transduction histidine kinase [Deltaproteobacteria bacterium]|nr:multi-sensor signal transduction histidine kinase [Deltaproteobacteria bacterium]